MKAKGMRSRRCREEGYGRLRGHGRSELAGEGRDPVLSRTSHMPEGRVPSSSPLSLSLDWDFGIDP